MITPLKPTCIKMCNFKSRNYLTWKLKKLKQAKILLTKRIFSCRNLEMLSYILISELFFTSPVVFIIRQPLHHTVIRISYCNLRVWLIVTAERSNFFLFSASRRAAFNTASLINSVSHAPWQHTHCHTSQHCVIKITARLVQHFCPCKLVNELL